MYLIKPKKLNKISSSDTKTKEKFLILVCFKKKIIKIVKKNEQKKMIKKFKHTKNGKS